MNSEPYENAQDVQTAGRAPALQSRDAVVLYDPQTGQVAHMHHVLTFEGAARKSRDEQVQNALEAAQSMGRSLEGLEALHILDFQPAAPSYRVDVEMLVLVEEPGAPRQRKSKPRRRAAPATKKKARKATKKSARRARK